MGDIVERLRAGLRSWDRVALGGVWHDPRCLEAADEIERLRQAIRLSVEDIENGNSESAYMTLSRFCEPDTPPDEFTGAAI